MLYSWSFHLAQALKKCFWSEMNQVKKDKLTIQKMHSMDNQ